MIEFKLLLRSAFSGIALALMLILTSTSLYSSFAIINHKKAQIERAVTLQAQRHAQQMPQYTQKSDAGEVGYYVFHTIANQPSAWSFLSIGHQDIMPAVQHIRLLGLQAQLHDGEAHNAERVISGTFDYAFIVVFLLPLLCIALCHQLFTIDKEQHRFAYLQVLIHSSLRFWSTRVFLRWLVAIVSVLLPFWVAAIYKNLHLNLTLFVSLLVCLYAAFWCVLGALISLWRMHSSSISNAMLLMMMWLLLSIVVPSLSYVVITHQTPAPRSADIALAHRLKVNDAWDLPKAMTFNAFFTYHPEWRNTPPVTGRFHWKWYYSFHHVGDMSVQTEASKQRAALLNHYTYTQKLGFLLPSVAAQNILDGIADNGLPRLLAHQQAVTHFHTQLRHYFYPYIFKELPFTQQDFANIPKPLASISHPMIIVSQFYALLGLVISLMLGFVLLMRKKL